MSQDKEMLTATNKNGIINSLVGSADLLCQDAPEYARLNIPFFLLTAEMGLFIGR